MTLQHQLQPPDPILVYDAHFLQSSQFWLDKMGPVLRYFLWNILFYSEWFQVDEIFHFFIET